MTDTLNRGYPYPETTADPDVPYWMQRLAEDVDVDVQGLAVYPFGHMGKTDGFQSISTAATITMAAAQLLRGGMTFDNATDSLVVPKTGAYRVTTRFYCSGGSTGRHTSAVMKLPAGGGAAVAVGGIATHLWKPDSADWAGFATGCVVLTAGDKVYMTGGGPANAYGGDGYNGCWLELEYLQL